MTFRKAAVMQVITGWQAVNTALAASRYNVGDPECQSKLDFCLSLMTK